MEASLDLFPVVMSYINASSKMIYMRLKKAITHVVADNRAAFVEGRSLTHNVLICHDLLRHYNRKTSPRCLVKINLRKAYDMVSWDFIKEALKRLGFLGTFLHIVTTCVSTTRFPVKVNGEGYGYFEGRRGLRHGDPMSPLLFILVMEYLSKTLKAISELPNFRFHPICKAKT